MKVSRLAPTLLISLLVLACGGGGGHGGGSTPTSPTPQGNTVVVSATLVALNGGVLEASLTLDGKEINHGDWSLSGGCAAGCVMGAMVGSVASGSHTVAMTVVRQTATVISYVALGQVSVANPNGTGQSIDLPQKNVSLKAGESVSYQISF